MARDQGGRDHATARDPEREMRIDELAVAAGVTSRTIRDYQARGLLPRRDWRVAPGGTPPSTSPAWS